MATPESAAWARGLLDGGWAAVFLPGEPARLGRLLLWQPAGAAAAQPAALKATLRDYQKRGLAWLAEMCELGLGGCLADDMGLGKTITLLTLHLHRQTDPATAGPTLVSAPPPCSATGSARQPGSHRPPPCAATTAATAT